MNPNLKKLKDEIANAELIESIDRFKNCTYEQKIDRCIEEDFKDTIASYKSVDNIKLRGLNLYGETLRTRKKAIKNTLPEFKKKFSNKYPEISLENEYIAYNTSAAFANYDFTNNVNFIFEAAAIYMLYSIDNHGSIDDLLKLLPKDEDSIALAIVNRDAFDLNFSDDIIRSLVSVIQNFFDYSEKNDCHYIMTKDYTTKEVTSLKTYDLLNKIFSLIDKDELEIICNNFRKDIDRIFDFVFKTATHYQKKMKVVFDELNDITREVEKIHTNRNNILLKETDPIDTLKEIALLDRISDLYDVLESYSASKDFTYMSLNFLYEDNSILDNDVEDFLRDEIYSFEIDDPFETCFAFVYLLFKKDNLVWLINPCNTLLKIAAEKLPWNKDVNFARNNNEKEQKITEKKLENIDNITAEDVRKSNLNCFLKSQIFNKEFFKQKYNDSWRWNDASNAEDGEILKWNLPQLIFDYTSCIMPLNLFTLSDNTNHGLELSGFNKEQIYLLKLLMATYGTSNIKYYFNNDSEEKEDNQNLDDLKSLKLLYEKKKADLNKTKLSLNELQKTSSKFKKENEKLIEENKSLKDELSQLRELVFNLQSNDFESDKNEEVSASLPYTPSKKTIIVGGTDTWINKMKERLNNVVIISSKVKINQDLLKTAEVIWIQTVALKHSDFYSISVYKEKRNIPINYFSFSNINKCIKQLVDYDLKK